MALYIFAWLVFATSLLSESLAQANCEISLSPALGRSGYDIRHRKNTFKRSQSQI